MGHAEWAVQAVRGTVAIDVIRVGAGAAFWNRNRAVATVAFLEIRDHAVTANRRARAEVDPCIEQSDLDAAAARTIPTGLRLTAGRAAVAVQGVAIVAGFRADPKVVTTHGQTPLSGHTATPARFEGAIG
jgi:hypothetical protein